ncbi:MAG: MlaD family protein [Rhodospirillales bacterium]|nr:MlaD family protein [Rhodospirillales bacterium]
MAKEANTKLIGAFVLAGIALIIAAFLIFGGGRLFQPVKSSLMYFTGSVQGLNVGSPVMFRGVPVGRVTDIDLLYDPATLSFLTRVDVNLFPENWKTTETQTRSPQEQFRELVDAGLRAQLIPVSLVTGQLGIGLDMFPATQAVFFAGTAVAPKDRGLAEIPTIPSTIERLETTMQRILAVIDKADFDQLSKDVDQTIEAIRNLITMPELRNMIVNANDAVRSADETMTTIKALVGRVDREVSPSLTSLRAAATSADATMADVRKMLPALRPQNAARPAAGSGAGGSAPRQARRGAHRRRDPAEERQRHR